jgi:protein-disulfide isomerase
VLDKYPNDVKLVFKNFPLPNHKFAMKAATAALAAHAQGKYWEFHDHLYKNYRNLNDLKIQEIANKLHLDVERLNKDMKDPAFQRLIIRDVNNGREIGVSGIPSVFVNGKHLNNRTLQGFEQMIVAELKRRL